MSISTNQISIGMSRWLDKLAIFLSGICVLHCLITPIALTILPLVAANGMLEDVLFHKAILWIVLPTSIIALFIGCLKHRDIFIVGSGVIGMLLLIIIAFFAHDLFTPLQERVLTSIAGLILAYSHVLNYRSCQNLTCDDNDCSSKHHH